MTTFSYVAFDASGRRVMGSIEAQDRDSAVAKVLAQGRFISEIKEQRGEAAKRDSAVTRGRVTRADLALFTRRLADLAEAGLPLDRVLQVVAEQSESHRLQKIAEEVLIEVRAGSSVSQALAKHPRFFPPVYTQTLAAGEASGQFPQVATRLADFQEKEVARRSQVVSALIYPSVLMFTAILVVIFLLAFVIPRLADVFRDLGDDLPLTTKMLLGVTGFLSTNGLYLGAGIIGVFVLYKVWSTTEAGAVSRDRFLMKMPMMGRIITKAVVSRFSRVLGTLLFGGVPILEALRLAGMSAGNRVFKAESVEVANLIREGRSIAGAMRESSTFPPVLTHMVAIGEETGDLPKMLSRVSDSLDFEVDNGMRRMTALLEPVIVLAMGAFVGFVVLSVLLPIFQAQDLVR